LVSFQKNFINDNNTAGRREKMTQIAYSELTKRFYFLPAKGSKVDITEDVKEIISKSASPSPGWVSVEERLPTEKDANKFGKVLLLYGDESCNAVHWTIVGKIEPGQYWHTHWMPLPQPPKH
jgi:hypothetical protein